MHKLSFNIDFGKEPKKMIVYFSQIHQLFAHTVHMKEKGLKWL